MKHLLIAMTAIALMAGNFAYAHETIPAPGGGTFEPSEPVPDPEPEPRETGPGGGDKPDAPDPEPDPEPNDGNPGE